MAPLDSQLPKARVIKKRTKLGPGPVANAYALLVAAAATSFVLVSAWLVAQPS